MDEERARVIQNVNRVFSRGVPHNAALGIVLEDYEPTGQALIRLPYAERLIGNPQTGVVHGGAITSLMDATCGAAVFLGMKPPRPIATLDLRIDYLKPAPSGRDIFCRATVTKITRHVAFVGATAFADEEDDPVAKARGTFMIFSNKRSSDGPHRGMK